MDIRSNQDENEAKDMTLDSEPSNPDPHNIMYPSNTAPPNAMDTIKTDPWIDRDD